MTAGDNIEWALKRSDQVHELAKQLGLTDRFTNFKEGFSLDAPLLTGLIKYGVDLDDRAQVNAILAVFRVILDAQLEDRSRPAEAVLGVMFDALANEMRSKTT